MRWREEHIYRRWRRRIDGGEGGGGEGEGGGGEGDGGGGEGEGGGGEGEGGGGEGDGGGGEGEGGGGEGGDDGGDDGGDEGGIHAVHTRSSRSSWRRSATSWRRIWNSEGAGSGPDLVASTLLSTKKAASHLRRGAPVILVSVALVVRLSMACVVMVEE